MKRSIAATIAVILLTLLVSGCGSREATDSLELASGRFFGCCVLGDRAWSVGTRGLVYAYNGKWTREKEATGFNLTTVYASSPNDVWAAGSAGTVIRYDGQCWIGQAVPTTERLWSVAGYSPNNIWAVGDAGTILRFDGTSWEKQESGVNWNLKGVSALDGAHVWVAGSGGVLFFDGSTWNVQWRKNASGIFTGLNGVSALDAEHVWAVGSADGGFSASILFFDGKAWVEQFNRFGAGVFDKPAGAIEPLKSVCAADANHVYAVTSGALLTFNGNEWSTTSREGDFLTCVSASPGKVLGAGFREGYDNLTNDTTYEATVFDLAR